MERGRGITYLYTSEREKTKMAHICAQLVTRGDQPDGITVRMTTAKKR